MIQIALYLLFNKSQPRSNNWKPKRMPKLSKKLSLQRKKIPLLFRKSLKNKLRPRLSLLRRSLQLPKNLPNKNHLRKKVKKNNQRKLLKLNLQFKNLLSLPRRLPRKSLQNKRKVRMKNLRKLWKPNLLPKRLLFQQRKKCKSRHNNQNLKSKLQLNPRPAKISPKQYLLPLKPSLQFKYQLLKSLHPRLNLLRMKNNLKKLLLPNQLKKQNLQLLKLNLQVKSLLFLKRKFRNLNNNLKRKKNLLRKLSQLRSKLKRLKSQNKKKKS